MEKEDVYLNKSVSEYKAKDENFRVRIISFEPSTSENK